MKTITKKIKLYTFEELSDAAKQAVKDWYLNDDYRPYEFQEYCDNQLAELFPNSSLQVEFSLGWCQGDGLNIYGSLDLTDIFRLLKNEFTTKEHRFLNWVLRSYGVNVRMQPNSRYCYCIADRVEYTEAIECDLEYDCMRGINYDVMHKFNSLIQDYMGELCSRFEREGYEYFYEVSDDDLVEWCNDMNYYFTKNGTVYYD